MSSPIENGVINRVIEVAGRSTGIIQEINLTEKRIRRPYRRFECLLLERGSLRVRSLPPKALRIAFRGMPFCGVWRSSSLNAILLSYLSPVKEAIAERSQVIHRRFSLSKLYSILKLNS